MSPIKDRAKALSEALKISEDLPNPDQIHRQILQDFCLELGPIQSINFRMYLHLKSIAYDYKNLSLRLKDYCYKNNIEILDTEMFLLYYSTTEDFQESTLENPLRLNTVSFREHLRSANHFWKQFDTGLYYTYDVSPWIQEIIDNQNFYQALHQKLMDRLKPQTRQEKISQGLTKKPKANLKFEETFTDDNQKFKLPATIETVLKKHNSSIELFNSNGKLKLERRKKKKLAYVWMVCQDNNLLKPGDKLTQIRVWYNKFGADIGTGKDVNPSAFRDSQMSKLSPDYILIQKLFKEEGIIKSEQPR